MSLIHQIALSLVPSVGSVNARKLLQHFGDPIHIFQSGSRKLISETGMTAAMAAEICNPIPLLEAEKQLRLLEKHGCQLLFLTDSLYPKRLKACHDAPVLLYSKGKNPLDHARIISIVGTRKPSSYGLSSCSAFLEELQDYNVVVISGLAYGIDIHVHRECLRLGIPTIAVLGHGLETTYPAGHRKTAIEMQEKGGVLTEFPFQSPCRPINFPMRNRIIAGLADITLVVEAAIKGGALITAELANSYHREVFAFPGRLNDPFTAGCNHLIQTNQAVLFQQASDIMELMSWEKNAQAADRLRTASRKNLDALVSCLNPALLRIYQELSKSPLQADALLQLVQLSSGELSLSLLDLEMKGLIQLKPGGIYMLKEF